jgi:hypothetical protein
MKTMLELLQDVVETREQESLRSFQKNDLIKWFSDIGVEGLSLEKIFSEFKKFAESEHPQFNLGNGKIIFIASSGAKKGRRYSIELGPREPSPKFLTIKNDIKNLNSPSLFLSTSSLVDEFLSMYDMTVGGGIINSSSLHLIRTPEDLDSIPNGQEGCYFIFSTLSEAQIPCFSEDNYKCHQRSIEKDCLTFRCLYNGKGKKTKERLMSHLFNKCTLKKAVGCADAEIRISDTGAMSLDVMDEAQARILEARRLFDSNKCKLKKVLKTIQPCSHLRHEGKLYFLNGIDIRESQWNKVTWAICTIRTDSEFGKILIEEAFARKNGRPPLCRRHG